MLLQCFGHRAENHPRFGQLLAEGGTDGDRIEYGIHGDADGHMDRNANRSLCGNGNHVSQRYAFKRDPDGQADALPIDAHTTVRLVVA
jgi:hypothetical protein